MPPEENFERRPKIAPEFGSVREFDAEINDVGYARYNYTELQEREEKLRGMINGATDVALFNSGAAAMHSAIVASRRFRPCTRQTAAPQRADGAVSESAC